jgi:hypothetical protein
VLQVGVPNEVRGVRRRAQNRFDEAGGVMNAVGLKTIELQVAYELTTDYIPQYD